MKTYLPSLDFKQGLIGFFALLGLLLSHPAPAQVDVYAQTLATLPPSGSDENTWGGGMAAQWYPRQLGARCELGVEVNYQTSGYQLTWIPVANLRSESNIRFQTHHISVAGLLKVGLPIAEQQSFWLEGGLCVPVAALARKTYTFLAYQPSTQQTVEFPHQTDLLWFLPPLEVGGQLNLGWRIPIGSGRGLARVGGLWALVPWFDQNGTSLYRRYVTMSLGWRFGQ